MIDCHRVQDLLASAGRAAVEREPEAREHLAGCTHCQRVLAALEAVDSTAPSLPRADAPPDVLARIEAAVGASREDSTAERSVPASGSPLLAGIAAAIVVTVAVGVLFEPLVDYSRVGVPFGVQSASSPPTQRGASLLDAIAVTTRAKVADPQAADIETDARPGRSSRGAGAKLATLEHDAPVSEPLGEKKNVRTLPAPARAPASSAPSLAGDEVKSEELAGLQARIRGSEDAIGNFAKQYRRNRERQSVEKERAADRKVARDADAMPRKSMAARRAVPGAESERAPAASEAPASKPPRPPTTTFNQPADVRTQDAVAAMFRGRRRDNGLVAEDAERQERRAETGKRDRAHALRSKREGEARASGRLESFADQGGFQPGIDSDRALARRYLTERQRLDGLAFVPANGYWSNNYLPGDPAMRMLELRLRDWKRAELTGPLRRLRLDAGARPNWQPFDPPTNAALAAYVHADRRALSGPARVRLQIGLKGADRQGGHRPAMNVGVVIDRRTPLPPAAMARVRALVTALAQARQPGDRFSLVVAGPGGGLEVPPESYRHGPLAIALEALAAVPEASGRPAVSLRDALASAAGQVAAADDSAAPIGASVVLLVAAGPLGAEVSGIESLVHANAVSGIVTSAIAVGETVDDAAIARLVLIGQGRRGVLEDASDAPALVDRELHAASRAVARAVRLRIQLAPGVKLLAVLGSRRLDEPAAERVREAELSIDRRLARNLGITGDRGEDEAGIQIVIPHFYAGDTHVVLLDVVVEGPGPVADVAVRYKDLVWLRNGITRTSLALDAGEDAPGRLERNVLKNELAYRLADAVRRASRLLAAGDGRAVAVLERQRALTAGLRGEITDWDADPELANDLAMLDEYLAALRSPAIGETAGRRHLADSLRNAAHRRLLAPPPGP